MNALTKFKKPSLTREQERIIRHQVALECQNITRKYEVMQDICWIYALVDELGFGAQRAERIYRKFWECREEVQRFVRADGENNDLEDGLRETMMERVLLTHNINVREWNEKYGKARIEYAITDGDYAETYAEKEKNDA